ncbi:hypothetical protein ABZ611_34535 [Streptomyces sp. NPDC007861]|uniref:hypothetical protein n=1 Tax=Streptomyces sp. NPDC007861 TaxID=3154893 RepID=UPI00340D6272
MTLDQASANLGISVIPECNATLLVLPRLKDGDKLISPPRTLLVNCGEPVDSSASEREQRTTEIINLLFRHLPKVIPGQRTIDDIIVTDASRDACGFLGEVMETYGFGRVYYAGKLGDYTADRVGQSTARWLHLQQRIDMQAFSDSTYNLDSPTVFLEHGSTKIYIVAANFGVGLRGARSGIVVVVNHGSTQLLLLGQAEKSALERLKGEYSKAVKNKSHVLVSGIATRVVIGRLPVRENDVDKDPWPWSAEKLAEDNADWLVTAPGYTPGGAWTVRQLRRTDLKATDDSVVFASPGEFQKGAP